LGTFRFLLALTLLSVSGPGAGNILRAQTLTQDKLSTPVVEKSWWEQNTIESFVDASTVTTDESVVAACCNCSRATNCCCATNREWNWRDTLTGFGGYEGAKDPQDFGVNANFGGRVSGNLGVPLWAEMGIGAQIGTSLNATGNAVQVYERVEGNESRTQNFTTVGVFQRTPGGLVWALGYDFLYQNSYDNFDLGQWRGRMGYFVTQNDEMGFQFAARENTDTGSFNTIDVLLRPITKGSFYWRHTWSNQVQMGCFVGMAENHGEANLALGDLPEQKNPLVFGSDVFVPVSDKLAIFGESFFMTPMDTGSVNAYFGIEIFPWGGAKQVRSNAFRPVLPVANNTSMPIDLRRR